LHHNFWTRNPSRSSKVSKDSDCSLTSSKNCSDILPPNGWRPGPGKGKNFFSSADEKTCRIFWDFYRVCRAYRTGEIPAQSHVRLGVVFFRKSPKAAGCHRVNSKSKK